MSDVLHLINGQDFGPPRNWEELEITVDWLNKKESGTINVSDLEFVAEANEYLQNRIMNGLSGGVGVFEGEPYQIKIGDVSSPIFIFDGYLDFTETISFIGGEETICSLKKTKGDDWLNDVADSFSFAYLYEEGIIKDSDFVKVPYVINYIPDGMQLIVLSISLFMMTKELTENIEKLSETIGDVTDASTPVIGTGFGANAGGPILTYNTNWDIGNLILVTIKAVARIAYIVAIVIAIKNLIEEIFEQLLPPKREHLGMTFRKLMQKGCEHLNMSFESSIDELDWVFLPRKTEKGGEPGETGFPTNSGPAYLFGDMIRTLKEMFNADYRITNNTLKFERRDQFESVSQYSMPSFFNDQDRLLDRFKLNTDEMVSNYNIFYQLDIQDQNTLDNSQGRVFQAITSPVSTNDEDLILIKNITEISIPFALALTKRDFTTVENVAKELAGFVDNLTGIFGNGTNFRSQIDSRIGAMLLSSNFITNPKVVVMNGSNLANDQRAISGVENLWDKYHFINSFAEYNGVHNQFFRYEQQRVPMTANDFALLLENNKATDVNGNEYLIEKIVYNPYSTSALIDFRVKRKYTNNLEIKIV